MLLRATTKQRLVETREKGFLFFKNKSRGGRAILHSLTGSSAGSLPRLGWRDRRHGKHERKLSAASVVSRKDETNPKGFSDSEPPEIARSILKPGSGDESVERGIGQMKATRERDKADQAVEQFVVGRWQNACGRKCRGSEGLHSCRRRTPYSLQYTPIRTSRWQRLEVK